MCSRLTCAGIPVRNENLVTASSSVNIPFLYSISVSIDASVKSSRLFSIAQNAQAIIKLTLYCSQKVSVFEFTDLATK